MEGNYESIVIVGIHEEIIRVIVLNTSKLNQTLKRDCHITLDNKRNDKSSVIPIEFWYGP